MRRNVCVLLTISLVLSFLLSCSTRQQLLTGSVEKTWNEWLKDGWPETDMIISKKDTTIEEYEEGQRDTYGCAGIAFKTHFDLSGKKICKYWRYNDSTKHPVDTLLILHVSKEKMILANIEGYRPRLFTNGRKRENILLYDLSPYVYHDIFVRLLKTIQFKNNKMDSLIVADIEEEIRVMDKLFPLIYNFDDDDHFGKYEGKIGYRIEPVGVGEELWVWVARGPIFFDYQSYSQIRTREGWMFTYRKDKDGDWKYKKCKKYKF